MHNLESWVKEIARENEFKIDKEIYRGFYYSTIKIRNIIYEGDYQDKKAILKIYDDPRLSDEPVAQAKFNGINNSKILFAPKIYKSELTSTKSGWLIMEKLSGGSFMKSPLARMERMNFLNLYLEYRKNFPIKPTRTLALAENLPTHEFHCFRISRWLQMANDREAKIVLNGEKPVLEPNKLVAYYGKSISIIRKEFLKRKMIWCHGHFKPKEIFLTLDGKYYLTDFAHVKMYPEGYELAFIIWADWLMAADWELSYKKWKKGIFEWVGDMEKINKTLKLKNLKALMRASLIERTLGTILADVCASDRPREEKEKRISLLFGLWKELAED